MMYSYILLIIAAWTPLNGQETYLASLPVHIKNTIQVSYSLGLENELKVDTLKTINSNSDTMNPFILNSMQKTFIESNLCLGFGGNEKISLSGIGLEVGLLQRFVPHSKHFVSISTGYERLATYIPTYSIPLMIGYQYNVDKDMKFRPFFYGKVGFGSAYLSDDLLSNWETRSANGGLRYEIGIGLISKLSQNLGWSLKTSFLSQTMDYHIINEWSQSHSKQEIKRIFIKLGILF